MELKRLMTIQNAQLEIIKRSNLVHSFGQLTKMLSTIIFWKEEIIPNQEMTNSSKMEK